MYATVVGMRGHSKCMQLRTGGGVVTSHLYVRTYTLFSYFWQHFCLLVSCFICRKYVEHSSPKAFKSAEFVPPLDTIKRNLEE